MFLLFQYFIFISCNFFHRITYTDWINTFTLYSKEVQEDGLEIPKTSCPKDNYKPPCSGELTPIIDFNGCLFLVCKSTLPAGEQTNLFLMYLLFRSVK